MKLSKNIGIPISIVLLLLGAIFFFYSNYFKGFDPIENVYGTIYIPADDNFKVGIIKELRSFHADGHTRILGLPYTYEGESFNRDDTVQFSVSEKGSKVYAYGLKSKSIKDIALIDSSSNRLGRLAFNPNTILNIHNRYNLNKDAQGAHKKRHIFGYSNIRTQGFYTAKYINDDNATTHILVKEKPSFQDSGYVIPYRYEYRNGIRYEVVEIEEFHVH